VPTTAPRLAASIEEYGERLARTRRYMHEQQLELLLIVQPEQYNWLSGYEPTSTFFYQGLLVPAGDQPLTLLCNKAELALCDETCWVEDVRVLWTYEDQVARTLEVLAERQLTDGLKRLGINLSSYYLKPSYAFALREALPGVEFVDITPGLDDLRLVKSPAEVDHLRLAAHIADLGVVAGINAIHEGVTDRDAMAAVQYAVFENGGQFPAYPGLVDARGTLHGTPTGRVLEPGDVVYLEVDGVARRYHCNISRSVIIGEPTPEIARMYSLVRETLDRATEALRPGARVAEIVELVAQCHSGYEQNTWGRFGFSCEITYPPHWIGALSLMPGDEHVLEPGMVITMEPGLAYYNGVTFGLGNNVLVTDDGPEILNNVPTDLFVR
jgi:Xaa-Pro aminopeptidase